MKEIWFNYVRDNKYCWCNGFTINRLEKVRQHVYDDSAIMGDLLSRHNGNNETPEQMKARCKETFHHCLDNFTCSILYKMLETGIYKTRTLW